MDLLHQTLNNRHAIQSLLCEGVLATTYKALDAKTNQEVALKVLKPIITSSRPEDLIRFKREINQTLTFKHPYIAQILDLGSFEGQNYLVMELVQGSSLFKLFQENKKFSTLEAVEVAYQIASALEYAHNQNLLHLDLRPSNVIIQPNPGGIQIKGLDLGLSHLIEYTQIKSPQDVLAVFSYISPEQSGIMKRASDERSDLYSLGIIFYQLLTGEAPFKGATIGELLHQHMAKLPTPPRRLNPQIPEVLEQIVLKLLSKEPEARYQTAKGLVADLELFKSGNTSFVIGKQDRLKKLLFRTRLIGREEEFNKLKDAFEKTKVSSGKVTLVKGEAGRGKSRLVDEMRSYVYEQKGTMVSGRCFSQENKTPYQPFRDILNEYIDRFKKAQPQEKESSVSRLKTVLGELGEIILKINPAMEEVLGKQPPLVALDPEREHRRFLMVASKFFLNLGTRDEPFVLYLDDLQWSDEATLSLLDEITAQIKEFPLLILGTFRDNEVTETHSLYKIIQEAKAKQYPIEEIPLVLFDQKRLTKFLSELLLEDENRLGDLAQFILDKSKGNPFFSLEITRQLVEEKALNYDEVNRHWLIDQQKLNQVVISSNIVDVVLRRIDLLDPDKLKLLSYASVVGREFPLKLLINLTKLSEENLITLIDECISLQLLEKSMERGKVLFVHDRIRDAFYAKVPKEQLQELHLKIAQSLEELFKENTESVLFDLAHHYTEAGNKDKALQYALPAAHKAKQNYANEEAIKYYNLSIGILEDKGLKKSLQWVEAKDNLADVCLTVGKNDEAITLCQEIIGLKQTPLEKANIHRMIGAAYYKKAEWEKCEQVWAEGLALLGYKLPVQKKEVMPALLKVTFVYAMYFFFPKIFWHKKGREVRPEDKLAHSFYFSLVWLYVFSDLFKYIWLCFRMKTFVESKIGKSKELAIAYGSVGTLYAAIPIFGLARKYEEKAVAITREFNIEWDLAQDLEWLGACYYTWKGEHDKGVELLQKTVGIYQKLGDVWALGMAGQFLAIAYLQKGDYPAAVQNLSNYYLSISEKIKDPHGICCAQDLIARAYNEMGELEKAEELLKTSLIISNHEKIWFVVCRANAEMGYLKFEQGKYDEAIKFLEKAKEVQTSEGATFAKDYLIYFYHYLADAYLEKLKGNIAQLTKSEHKKELSKIRNTLLVGGLFECFWPNHFGGALRVNGKYNALLGHNKTAEKYFLKSIEHTKRIGRRYELGRSLFEYAKFLESIGKPDQAKQRYLEAYNVFKEIGAKLYIQRTAAALGIKAEETGTKEATAQERLAVERRLNTLISVSHDLSSILDVEELLSKIVSSAIEVSGAERGFLLLSSPDKKTLQVKIAQGLEAGLEITPLLDSKKYKLCRVIIDEANAKVSSLLYSPQVAPSLNQDEDIKTYQIKSVICTPLKVRGELLGLLYLDNCLTEAAFNEQDLNLINS
ncbi:MAG: protein kinase, partial [Candidatus Omnitrophota bacterium]